jgi:TRAP-type C4-dicarboxylate transport system permease small subunit
MTGSPAGRKEGTERPLSLGDRLAAIPEAVCVGLVAGIPLVLVSAVIGRYTGWFHLRWADEIARAMIVWLAFLGAGVAVRRGAHFRIAILESRARTPFVRTFSRYVAHLSLLVTGLLLVFLGYRLMQLVGNQTTVVLKIPVSWIYLSMPVGGLLFVVYSLRGIFAPERVTEER